MMPMLKKKRPISVPKAGGPMAEPQITLGDLLGKFGISMGDNESRRQDMIRRLKTVKDPEERDRIIWALAGQKKEGGGGVRASTGTSWERLKAQSRSAPAGYPSRMPTRPSTTGYPSRTPTGPSPAPPAGQLPGLGNIFNYVVPILFVFFGITNISKAIEAFRAGAGKEEVFMQLLIGLGFIAFALMSLFARKVKKNKTKSPGSI
jgi:hypothetical protein